jgi:hypothetical protein
MMVSTISPTVFHLRISCDVNFNLKAFSMATMSWIWLKESHSSMSLAVVLSVKFAPPLQVKYVFKNLVQLTENFFSFHNVYTFKLFILLIFTLLLLHNSLFLA